MFYNMSGLGGLLLVVIVLMALVFAASRFDFVCVSSGNVVMSLFSLLFSSFFLATSRTDLRLCTDFDVGQRQRWGLRWRGGFDICLLCVQEEKGLQ